ncbi:MAG TPA: mannonate dehydratase [Bryobacteraceae bacterium]
MRISRRKWMQSAGAAGLAAAAPSAPAATTMPGPRFEGKDTPKICLELNFPGWSAPSDPEEAAAASGRHLRQLGVEHAISGMGRIPWQEETLRAFLDRYKKNGIAVANIMISGFNRAIYNRPGRDEDIENVIQSIRAAGKCGLPVVEYNWYAHRTMEGYFAEEGRAGSGWTGFDYERPVESGGKQIPVRELPPLEQEGAHTLDEMWTNIAYFLKAVIPEAEKAGVRLALHPNDPPAPISRGSQQIMGTIDGWKKLISIVNSPSNGITFDCGVTKEMGGDPVEVCRYFGSRDRINHVHFRNVKVKKPYERYTEVFIDEGENNMFAVMRELVRLKYTRLVYPEHPRGIDYDRERPDFRPQYPGGGGYAGYAFNVGYTRAMMQAALTQS